MLQINTSKVLQIITLGGPFQIGHKISLPQASRMLINCNVELNMRTFFKKLFTMLPFCHHISAYLFIGRAKSYVLLSSPGFIPKNKQKRCFFAT